jgi:hypothetical protein
MKYFLVGLAVLCVGCDNPVKPSATTINGKPIREQRSRATHSFDSTQLGHATLDGVDFTVGLTEVPGTCYQRDFFTYKGGPLFIVWNANDPVNQVDVAHSPYPNVHFTLSDFANGPLAADNNLWPVGCKPSPPTTTTTTTTTIQPTVKTCSAASFVSWSHAPITQVVATGIETETVIVKDGAGPVVWYLSSWAAWGTFEFGVPLPQTRIHMTTQTLHDGVNTIQVQIATISESLIWQIEGGCEPGPPILTSAQDREHGGQFDWLDDDGGDLIVRAVTSVFRSERKGKR